MTENLTVAGTLLAADTDTRTLKGLLLPFGEEGRTSVGRVVASAGAITLPSDPTQVRLNVGHDREKPVGRATSLVETPEGLVAEFRVANTRAGDDLLVEAAERLRTGLSVELDNVVIRAGKLLGGVLTDVGAVIKSAFPSAQLIAADAGDLPEDDTNSEDSEDDESENTENADTESDDQEEEQEVPAATAPSDLQASAAQRGGFKATDKIEHASDLFAMLADAYNRQDSSRLTAALADVTQGANTTGIYARTNTPAWLGELWSGRAYSRKYVPLCSQGTLTGMKIQGWRWTQKPEMADYAGQKTAVPSNTVAVENAEAYAQRLAAGFDVDRVYWDLGSPEFIESFLRALVESYAKLSDQKALQALVDAATNNPVAAGPVPTDVNPAMAAIVDGALAILDEGTPSFALVAPDLYRSVLLTRNDDTLAYLNASLGLEDGTVASFRVLPAPQLGAGEVVVGAREAVTFYELGQTPIRVEAEDIANGGRDLGAFGYYASIVNDNAAIALVDTTP